MKFTKLTHGYCFICGVIDMSDTGVIELDDRFYILMNCKLCGKIICLDCDMNKWDKNKCCEIDK